MCVVRALFGRLFRYSIQITAVQNVTFVSTLSGFFCDIAVAVAHLPVGVGGVASYVCRIT